MVFAGALRRSYVLTACMVLSGPALAAYGVSVDAPGSVKKLLEDNLDLIRRESQPDLSAAQFDYMVRTAPDQVRQLVATEGFFTPTTRIEPMEAGKKVVVHVDPGPRTLIEHTHIAIEGPIDHLSPERVSAIKEDWSLQPGAPFRQEAWDNAKNAGLQALQSTSFAAATITHSEARIDPVQQQAKLDVIYDSGPAFTLGPLLITGSSRYPQSIIQHVNPLTPGEPYDVKRLLLLQRQIASTPYYGNVIVGIDDNPAAPELTPVRVQVTELPVQLVQTGVGYSSDAGASLSGRYSYYNVFNRAYVFDAQAKIEQERQTGSLELSMPPDAGAYVNSAVVSYDRNTLDGVDLRSMRVGVKRLRRLENIDSTFSILYYRDRLQQINGDPVPPAAVLAPGNQQAVVFGYGWARRKVDDPLFPRSGNILNADLGVAFKGVLTNQTFGRVDLRAKQFFPVAKRDIFILRAELGALITNDADLRVPASLLFRAGGTETIRGYGYLSVGNLQGTTVYPAKYMMIGSAEYQHWFNATWGAATFFDAGAVTNNWQDRNLRTGVGGGVRYHSPVGTINVDLGYGIQQHQIRPHISLGVVF